MGTFLLRPNHSVWVSQQMSVTTAELQEARAFSSQSIVYETINTKVIPQYQAMDESGACLLSLLHKLPLACSS